MASSKPTIDVALGVLINASGELLLGRRPEGVFMPGYWEFPGGKLDPDETPVDALARELHEELGVEFSAPEPVDVFFHEYPDRCVKLHVWKIKDFSPEPKGVEGQTIRWVPVDALDGLPLLEGSLMILPHLFVD
jgi:8-oxo-dGTP diphosphatase